MKPRVFIHACKAREKYVIDYLVPELTKQGFDPIDIYFDHGSGNLEAYIASYKALPDKGNVWHLEDDVIPDRRFYNWACALSAFPGIVCGFGSSQYYGLRDFGYCLDASEMFLSFPCIRIPCETVKGFLRWFDANRQNYKRLVKTGKNIDRFFRDYAMMTGLTAFNFKPCMVEHIDSLIGGSLVNPDRGEARALIFEDDDAINRLKDWVIS